MTGEPAEVDGPELLFPTHRREPLGPDEMKAAARHWSAWWDQRIAESGGRS